MRLQRVKGKFMLEYDKDTEVLKVLDKESGELDEEFKLDAESIEKAIDKLKLHRDIDLEVRSHKDSVIKSEKVEGLEILVQSYQDKKGRVHQVVLKLPREGSSTKELLCKKFTYKTMDKRIKYFEDMIGGNK